MLNLRSRRERARKDQRRVAEGAARQRLHRHFVVPLMVQSGAFFGSFYLVEISLENLRAANGEILFAVTLALGAVGEVIFLWMLIWSALAALSSLTLLPASAQQKLRQIVMVWGTGTAKRSLQKAAATTVITGSLLVGTTVAAHADSGEAAPDHLWPEITQTTQPRETTVNALESLTVTAPANGSKSEDGTLGVHPKRDSDFSEDAHYGGSESEQNVSPTEKAQAQDLKTASPTTAPRAPKENPLPTNRHSSSSSFIKRSSVGMPASASAPAQRGQDRADKTMAPTKGNREPVVDVPRPGAYTNVMSAVNAKKTYTVEEGDSLWLIASKYLGPAATNHQIDAAWRSLYAANQTVIGSNPDLIEPGQVLEIVLS